MKTINNQDIITLQQSSNQVASKQSATPPPQHEQLANADTGTTGHYIAMKDINCLHNVRTVSPTEAIKVILPTGEQITSTHTGELNYSELHAGKRVHVFKSLWGSLLGIGDLCDEGLTAVFTKNAVFIVDTEANNVILTGLRDRKTRLWMIALRPITPQEEKSAIATANAINMNQTAGQNSNHQQPSPPKRKVENLKKTTHRINKASTQILDTAGDRVEFFSRVFCSPAESTIINAVTKRWIQFPGITANILKRHRKRLRTHESAAGHLDQIHQNHHRRETPTYSAPTNVPDQDKTPINILTYVHTEGNHMDGTGRFTAVSHQGNQYQLVLHSEGANYIKIIPMPTRSKDSYLKAHQTALDFYDTLGYTPTFQRLDNETSNAFMEHLRKRNIKIDLVPPHQHRRNKAERDIRTYKNHFIAALAGVDPDFPMMAWDELIPQIETTLNLLRPSTTHPRMSAWEAVHGKYDFDAHPMAPPGTAITIHEKPNQRATWSKHGVKGFYLGPAMNTYRSYRVWVTAVGSTRITDTVAWHPHGYHWEHTSPLELVTQATDVLAEAMHHLATTPTTNAQHSQPINDAALAINTQLKRLQRLYDESENEPTLAVTPAPTKSGLTTTPEQRVEAPTDTQVKTPTRNQELRKSRRRKHKWLNRANATTNLQHLSTEVRMALMIAKRFSGGKPKKPRHHSVATKNYNKYVNQVVRAAQRTLIHHKTTWNTWTNNPNVELDSNGTPFFLAHHHAQAYANTAMDLDDKGKKLTIKTALASPQHDIWLDKHGEEIARLFESNTIKLIQRADMPSTKKAAYYNPQVRTKMKDGALQYRVRGTIGGNQIQYDGDTAAHTASMQLIKILLNSVVSSKGAKFMTADIKDFYLGTPLPNTEYMRIDLAHIPDNVIQKYHMQKYAHNDAVIVEVHKGIYGLPQAGKLAQDRLVKHLATHGYHQAKNTPCLFQHETNSVTFTLVVDDFGIKYTEEADADHLLHALRELYIMTEDRASTQKYVGITIAHHRQSNTIKLSMPGYVEKAIKRFGSAKHMGARSPLTYIPPNYGTKAGQAHPELPPEAHEYVNDTAKTFIQEATGVFLFYSRAVDPTMLTAVTKISSQQSKPTRATLQAVDRLLSYAERYPTAEVIIRASDMQLHAQSDASYHSESGARSRAGGILYFGTDTDGNINGAIEYISMIIPTVCSSAAEAEYAALFLLGREATNARHILTDLGYPQHTTTIMCDNSCAVGIANDDVKQKRSKAIDMRYHWIRDQVAQGKLQVKWEKGSANLADYFTKAHPVSHYNVMRRTYYIYYILIISHLIHRDRRERHELFLP